MCIPSKQWSFLHWLCDHNNLCRDCSGTAENTGAGGVCLPQNDGQDQTAERTGSEKSGDYFNLASISCEAFLLAFCVSVCHYIHTRPFHLFLSHSYTHVTDLFIYFFLCLSRSFSLFVPFTCHAFSLVSPSFPPCFFTISSHFFLTPTPFPHYWPFLPHSHPTLPHSHPTPASFLSHVCLIPIPCLPHSHPTSASFLSHVCLIPVPHLPHSHPTPASFPSHTCLIPVPHLPHSHPTSASFPSHICLIPIPFPHLAISPGNQVLTLYIVISYVHNACWAQEPVI